MQRFSQSEYRRPIVLAAFFLILLCSAAAVAAECTSGCTCMLPADAKLKGYDPCGGQLSVCGYDRYQNSMYCYRTGLSLVPRTVAPLSVTTTSPQGTCAEGCSCMLEADAKQKFGTYSRCSETPCYRMVTGSQQLYAYCFRPGTTMTVPVPSCPTGCSCISNATATARGGTWTRCTADICGYEQGTATLAAVVSVPKYCMKQQETTPVCPDGCACLSDEDAKLKGLLERCDSGQTPCGYRTVADTTAVAAVRVPLFCYRTTTTVTTETPAAICPENCGCMNEGDAKLKFGAFNYTRCSEKVCGYDQTATSAYASPRYCFRYSGTITAIPGTAVCPPGCSCLQEADAKLKFGTDGYTRCQADTCGYDPSATSANGIPKYCFGPAVTVTPTTAVCPPGCTCATDDAAKEKGLTPCRGTRTICGYTDNKQPLYCFEQVPSPTCVYDYQKNSCTGTCPQGYTCGLLASEKDATGKVIYGVCGCTGQPATPCTFDTGKNSCTGTCKSGAACTVVGKQVDEKTGAVSVTCGCPPQSTCVYDYNADACKGTCTQPYSACGLNTIYRDPASGRATYADCQCKLTQAACSCDPAGGGCTGGCNAGQACTMVEKTTDNAGKVVCSKCECRDTCVLTANNDCTGTCADQQPCSRTVTKDTSGQEKVSCGCGGTPAGTPAGVTTRQPGFFEGIAGFINKLFGGK